MPANRPSVLLAVALGGLVGTLLRAGLAELAPTPPAAWPWATLAANVLGCLVLGATAGRTPRDPAVAALLAAGIAGSLSTFSALAGELRDLLAGGHAVRALAYAAVSLAAGLLALAGARRVTAA